LLAVAEKIGVKILLEHRMTTIVRRIPLRARPWHPGGQQWQNAADSRPQGRYHRHRWVDRNINFRRMFDPRLTEEYCGLGGMPWSNQDASGELAAMAIGASLWGLYNQTVNSGRC